MGTIDAAKALLWQDEIGSLEVGKAADVTLIDGHNLRLSPALNPIGMLVRYAISSDVRSVLVAGKLVVDKGRLLTIDEETVLDEAAVLSRKLAHELVPRRYQPLTVRSSLS